MSFQAMTWAVEQELPAMQKIVLLMLANRTNHDTGLCFPSHETLATECGMDKRSVIRQIEKLEAAGLLSVNRSTNKPNSYTLNLSSVTKSPSDRESPLAVTESH
ncbi:MAG: helix-turn-helix domain-containing protein, partial [Methylococcales bacterium]|nr:helix-turn-helix domain-containing protein [Methylococcales bacterium]